MSWGEWSRRRALAVGAAVGAGAALTACGAGADGAGATARATVAAPKIISREAWGAAAPDHTARAESGFYDAVSRPGGWRVYAEPLAEALNTVVVHHSALPASDGALAIQRLHMQTRGYADIGYHFLIDEAGLIYAGRDVGVRGAHTGGANTGTVGVALLGNFEQSDPAAAQMDGLRTLCAYLAATYTLTHLAGHRDFQPGATVCPGAGLRPLLPGLAEELGLEFGTGGYAPPG